MGKMKSWDIKHVWLIVQGFLQRLDIDYEKTYSPMMDATIFRYLICLTVLEWLDLRFMDVIIAYLCESLDNDTHTHTHTYIYENPRRISNAWSD